MKIQNKISILKLLTLLIMVSIIFTSCSQLEEIPIDANVNEIKQYIQDLPYTEVEFILEIPKPTQNEIIFELVDDITGIELNPTRYVMTKLDDNHYKLILPVKVPSLLKYRFYKNNGLPIYETNSENTIIEYRMAYISTTSIINNQLTNWSDEQYAYKYGRVSGQALNAETNSPIPNALVVIGSMHGYTNSMGKFLIENLTPGKHNLVILSTDGEYQTFQQEAIIGEGLTTPASIGMQSSKFVNVSFIIQPPEDNPSELPIRILGNTYQLGNVFGNIYNGTSIAPARAPKLTSLPDGNYTITLSLPSGFDLRYKYSLGDGFWNAELNNENNFVIRQLVIPDQDTIVNDVIQSWKSLDSQSVEFLVNIPKNTPDTDKISIQFNSFGWSPPIQLWKTNDFQYSYRLFGPFHLVSDIEYRVCRNDACGTADDDSGPINGYSFSSQDLPQVLNVNVTRWKGWNQEIETPSLSAPEIINRGSDFVTGFAFSNNYSIYTPIYVDSAYKNILEVNGNTIIIPIKWTLQSLNPVIFSPITGKNPLWKDLVLMIQKAKNQNLNVWLAPEIEISPLASKQFVQGTYINNWEENFGSLYSEYLIYTADLANYMSVQGVIYPTDIIHLQNFENYQNFTNILNAVLISNIDNIRTRFSTNIFLSLDEKLIVDNPLMAAVDGYFITPTINFIDSDYVRESYKSTLIAYIDEVIYPNVSQYEKPVYFGLNFPSIKGAEKGCITEEDSCFNFDVINQIDLLTIGDSFEIDLLLQVEMYDAAFQAINETPWVSGIISKEYNPQVALMDSSSSVRGKPAMGIFWYWFPRMLGINN